MVWWRLGVRCVVFRHKGFCWQGEDTSHCKQKKTARETRIYGVFRLVTLPELLSIVPAVRAVPWTALQSLQYPLWPYNLLTTPAMALPGRCAVTLISAGMLFYGIVILTANVQALIGLIRQKSRSA